MPERLPYWGLLLLVGLVVLSACSPAEPQTQVATNLNELAGRASSTPTAGAPEATETPVTPDPESTATPESAGDAPPASSTAARMSCG